MEQKTKFIIIGLVGFSVICLFLFFQGFSQQQTLVRESNDLKSENSTLLSKVGQLENALKENQGKIDSLQADRNKAVDQLGQLQDKFEAAIKARDQLTEKLKKQAGRNEAAAVPSAQAFSENSDAYWGAILKAKTELEMQLVSIRTELKSLQISNESLQRQKSVLELDINSLRNEKKDLLRQIDYNQKLIDSMSQEVVRERNDKVAIQENFKMIKAENVVLSRQLRSLSSRKMILDKKIQSLQEGKTTLGNRLNEMETMLTNRISQIDSLKNELDAIKSGKPLAAVEKKRESVELPAIVVRSSPSSEKDAASVFAGKVLAVNADNNFVVIDLGSSSGVKVGDSFNVYRGGKSIGSIEVIQARDSLSACDIKRMSSSLKIGDNIK